MMAIKRKPRLSPPPKVERCHSPWWYVDQAAERAEEAGIAADESVGLIDRDVDGLRPVPRDWGGGFRAADHALREATKAVYRADEIVEKETARAFAAVDKAFERLP